MVEEGELDEDALDVAVEGGADADAEDEAATMRRPLAIDVWLFVWPAPPSRRGGRA